MEILTFPHMLLAALAVLLITAAVWDWRTRTIPDWVNGAIAVLAPLWWWLGAHYGLTEIGWQLAVFAGVFALFTLIYMIGGIGGGDVKMIFALALWFPLLRFVAFMQVMALAGGVLTLVMIVRHRILRAEGRVETPYGIAIAFAGLWTLF